MNRAVLINSLEDIIAMVKDSNEKECEPVYFIPPQQELSQDEMAENEFDKLGFFVSFHPLDNYRIKLSELPKISELVERISGESITLGGLMMNAIEKTTKAGSKMGVFTLEDLTGRVEVVAFGRTFEQYKYYLNKKNPAVLISGRLNIEERDLDDGEVIRIPKIVLNKIQDLEESQTIDMININLTKKDNIKAIYDLLTANPGDIKISIEFEGVLFNTTLTYIQDRSLLTELSKLCHFETRLSLKGKA